MGRFFLRAMVAILLVGCGTPPRSPDSPYVALPVGSRMVLEQPITIPSPGIAVWLQAGRVLPGNPDRYEPGCLLEMKRRSESARTLQPDQFLVTRVERVSWAVAAPSPFRRAALTLGAREDGGPMAYEMRTVIYLESPRQPEVSRLTCQHWDRPWFPGHLTINQIRATLAGLFRIEGEL